MVKTIDDIVKGEIKVTGEEDVEVEFTVTLQKTDQPIWCNILRKLL